MILFSLILIEIKEPNIKIMFYKKKKKKLRDPISLLTIY